MKLIVGLGNPGLEYVNTKHNVGFNVIDYLCSSLKIVLDESKFNGIYKKFNFNNEQIIIAKPMTYMNLSGEFISKLINFYKIKIDDILVIYDDIDTPISKIKLRLKGSSGGQNGMKNIINLLNTDNIKRIKIGIGKPSINLTNYVLSKFNSEQIPLINQAFLNATCAAIEFINNIPFDKIMNKYNAK